MMYRDNGKYNHMPPRKDFHRRPLPTLYASREDLKNALLCAIDILNGPHIPKDDQGFSSITILCDMIKKAIPNLSYLTKNHIVELFFKDKTRKIMIINDDQIKYKEVKYVQPPEKLYFGTLSSLVEKMKRFGIRSSTKGYIKLYNTPFLATEFAKKFVTDPRDVVVALSIRAFDAFTSGIKFSVYKPHEYVVVRIDQKFIEGVVQ